MCHTHRRIHIVELAKLALASQGKKTCKL